MSNSFIQALLMDDPEGGAPPPSPTCVPDTYYSCGPTADPYWASVVLLCPFDTDNSDLSATGATFTNSGTSISTTVKKYGAGALTLNGPAATKYIVSDNQTALRLDGDFTIEFWVYMTTQSGANTSLPLVAIKEVSTGFTDYSIQTDSSERITATYRTSDAGATTSTSASAITYIGVQVWQHIALTRSGSAIKVFVGGSHVVTATSAYATPAGARTITIGNTSATSANTLAGSIDDLRITKGISRYSDSYIPPTAAVPTSLDATWSAADPRTVAIVHFDGVTETPIMLVGGTVNANDSITYNSELATATILDATAVSYGTGGITFTVDNTDNSIIMNATSKLLTERYREVSVSCTMTYAGTPSGTGSNFNFLEWGFGTTLPAFGFSFSVTAGVPKLSATGYDSANNSSAITMAVPTTGVYEVKFIANGIIQWYVDSVLVRTYTASGNHPYMPRDGIKFGSTARGTDAGITSVTIKDVQVTMLGVADASCYQPKYLEYRGNAVLSAAQIKFGDSALYVPGSAASVLNGAIVTDHQDFAWAAGEWTVELWAYRIDNSQVGQLMTGLHDASSRFTVDATGLIDLTITTSAGPVSGANVATWPLLQWNHVVLQRVGDNVEFFLNGTLTHTLSLAVNAPMNNIVGLTFGCLSTASSDSWNGYIDEVRITRGVARYTGNFTPETLPNCNGTDPGGVSVNGTEYPTSVTATVQQGSMTLLNHYQPLTGQGVTVSQNGVGFAGGTAPSGVSAQYTAETTGTTEVSGSALAIGTLTFLSTGEATYNGENTNLFTWIEPVAAGAASEFEIYVSKTSGASVSLAGTLILNSWIEVPATKTVVLSSFISFTLPNSASTNAVLRVQVRPKSSSTKYGNPYYYRDYNLTLWLVYIPL